MAEVNWNINDKESLKPTISFFYESKDLAVSDLKRVYEKLNFIPKVSDFNEYGNLIEEWPEEVGIIRRKEKMVKYRAGGIHIDKYEDENKSGYLLSIKVVSPNNDLNIDNLAVAKTLKNVILSEVMGKNEGKPSSTHPTAS